MKPKTIAIDLRSSHHTGLGRHLRCTFSRLVQMDTGFTFVAIASREQDLSWLPTVRNVDVLTLPHVVPLYSPLEHVLLPPAIRRAQCDLVHFNNFNTPAVCPAPYLVTIHDTIYLKFPWDCASLPRALYARALLRRSARGAAHVATVSQHSRRDIERMLRVPRDRISVIYNGGWEDGRAPEPSLKALVDAQRFSPYVLYVGNQTPHKNIARLAEAVEILRQRRPNLRLLAAGKKGRHFPALDQDLRRRGLSQTVVFPGHVDDDLLAALYQKATLVATASLYEGFGLPVLEALSAGAPVVASRASSIPEVAGDAALLADPEDPAAFAQAMESIMSDASLRSRLIRRGPARARLFTWDRVEERLAGAYERALVAAGGPACPHVETQP